jgi:hypothetical protein
MWCSSVGFKLIDNIDTIDQHKIDRPTTRLASFFLDLISNLLTICKFHFCVVQYLFVISLRTFGPLTICDY